MMVTAALLVAGVGCDQQGISGWTADQAGDACPAAAAQSDPTMAGCPPVPLAALGEASHPDEGAHHVVVCSTACYGTNPPSSGDHYPTWPVYKTYAAPVPWGFLVHGLEHGAIVVSYNCPCGCADETSAAQAWIDALPEDSLCGTRPRVVMAPDPALDVRWAASAWTWTLRAQAFDAPTFQAFFLAHYDQGPETICEGATDGTAAGWCR